MYKTISTIAISLVLCCGLSASESNAGTTDIANLLQTNCVSCHGPEKQKGKFRLDDVSKLNSDQWFDIYDAITNHDMPPEDEKQPSSEDRAKMIAEALRMSTSVVASDASSNSDGPVLRRLNKREYSNTMRDLLGLQNGKFDPALMIYNDEVAHGFDTEANLLVMSDDLLLEYAEAAQRSIRQALFTNSPTPPKSELRKQDMNKWRMNAGHFYSYKNNAVTFKSAGRDYLSQKDDGTIKIPGIYRITVTACGVDRKGLYPAKVETTPPEGTPCILGFAFYNSFVYTRDRTLTFDREFTLKDNKDTTFTFEAWIDAGEEPVFTFVNGMKKPANMNRQLERRGLIDTKVVKEYLGPGIRISALSIEGPTYKKWPTDSLVTTYGTEQIPNLEIKSDREAFMQRFAARAFRQPVSTQDVAPYINYMNQYKELGLSWGDACVKALIGVLVSPKFLYVYEKSGPLDSFALANRLSYGFWSTTPDQELLRLAQSKELMKTDVLSQQVDRLLNDPRGLTFADNFATQWLKIDTLGSMPPDEKDKRFKEYYRDNLPNAMKKETLLYFRNILNNNRSVCEFLDSNYTFANQALANLYDVPFTGKEDEFTQISFPNNSVRGGLLGHASILTLTANGVDSSPVVRGVWVLESLLGTPAPPPPPLVPALTPDTTGAKTIQQVLALHRQDVACKSCHQKIDPLGIALESFDPIGRVRAKYEGGNIINTAASFKNTAFKDVSELKKLFLGNSQNFARNLLARVAEYIKGRKLQASDYSVIDDIVRQSADKKYLMKDMIKKVMLSEVIRNR
jgi:Protein of unknown function (DUF1592)/Protein of unknown function (DUF1588)/Protein of unknown function (DUF1587)/Protein of unknown function (DUF1595)/Protein of unknown function (DUF1585)/Cytochrome C oxidase, cbb3-type, subunit III